MNSAGSVAVFVRHFDAFDVGVAPQQSRLLHLDGFAADFAFLPARVNEALAGEVIHAGTQIVIACGHRVSFGSGLIGQFFQPASHRAPLFAPRVGFALTLPEPLANLVDLTQRDRAVRRHAFGDETRVRPREVSRKVLDPRTVRGHYLLPADLLKILRLPDAIACPGLEAGTGLMVRSPGVATRGSSDVQIIASPDFRAQYLDCAPTRCRAMR